MKALINNGKIRQVTDAPFEVAEGFDWVECPDDCTTRWSYVDGVFVPPDPPNIEEVRQSTLAKLAHRRFQYETSGVLFQGVRVSTDINSQTKLLAARILSKEAQGGGNPVKFKWKGEDGWLDLSPPDAIALTDAVNLHVQTAFEKEKAHYDAVMALQTVEELEAYDVNGGWE